MPYLLLLKSHPRSLSRKPFLVGLVVDLASECFFLERFEDILEAFVPTVLPASLFGDFVIGGLLRDGTEASFEAAFVATFLPAGLFDDFATEDLLPRGLEANLVVLFAAVFLAALLSDFASGGLFLVGLEGIFAAFLLTIPLTGSLGDFALEGFRRDWLETTFEVAVVSAFFPTGFFADFAVEDSFPEGFEILTLSASATLLGLT